MLERIVLLLGQPRAHGRRRFRDALLILAGLVLASTAAGAQPFRFYLLQTAGTASGFQVPSNPALNPTAALTVEAWVYHQTTTAGNCRNIAGKGYTEAWWLGICDDTFRTYVKGTSSQFTAGAIPPGEWTHVAVTFDGSTVRHYINGELISPTQALAGPLTTSTKPLDIGSDEDYSIHQPQVLVDELRIWNVARSLAQIRAAINTPIATAQPGLVAVYNFDPPGTEPIHGYNGAFFGGADVGHIAIDPLPCSTSATALCLLDHFQVTAHFRNGPIGTAETPATVASCTNPGSGLFWFFSPDNWEVMVKAINGCVVNSRFWVFSAATTNVYYRLEVLDGANGTQKIYFNYAGPPAPAVTDTDAFDNCV